MTMNVTPRATPSEAGLERRTVTGPRILVVDDDPAFGEATARMLRAAGFEVFLAPDYRLALEDLESTRPIYLLITDIVMPDRVNGLCQPVARTRLTFATRRSSSIGLRKTEPNASSSTPGYRRR
jgi:PleD family two-component response regulator